MSFLFFTVYNDHIALDKIGPTTTNYDLINLNLISGSQQKFCIQMHIVLQS